uniref:PATJ crumbs cell polarity complex component n=1 Tax=Poecilia formosa TaxID=48698 RepID=A0A087XAD3_POEFO
MLDNVPVVSSAERQQVLAALDRLQNRLVHREEWSLSAALGSLKEALQSPLFGRVLTLQHSVRQLQQQLSSLPPDARSDFSFSRRGQLIMSAAPSSVLTNGSSPLSLQAPPPTERLQQWIQEAAKGRRIEPIVLTRPASGGLGFSVVGLNPAGSGGHGVFVKHIQPGGIAGRDGRLQEQDQILVINGSPLEPGRNHQAVLSLLQQPGETVELVVAREWDRDRVAPGGPAEGPVGTDLWGHVEEIELSNDGSGLGFGIVGGKTSGVVVRTVIPDSVADRDGRLRTGDHILRIGSTPTSGLTSDQVVKVLQACGGHVTMLIARDPQGQAATAPAAPAPPDSAPFVNVPPPLPDSAPGYEIHEVPLTKKDGQSLGISIVGFNPLTSQDAVGVFVKHVVPGSAADQSGNIRVHDRLLALDDVSLHGMTNQEVLEVMKQTGQTVVLTLVRKKVRGPERSLDKGRRAIHYIAPFRHKHHKMEDSLRATKKPLQKSEREEIKMDRLSNSSCQHGALIHRLESASDAELRAKWEAALGPQYLVLVVNLDPVIQDDAELQKSSKLLPIHILRLGVELDSFDGHHYISSVAPGGPVDRHGVLRPEDELLEVNGVQLYGKSRREAVSFLKEVPPPFTLVCCRLLIPDQEPEPEPEPSAPPQPAAEHRSIEEEEEEEDEGELALWSPEVGVVELQKEAERGLGFSLLDYQDPLDPGRCVMVIRSLVPGGSAERHGGLLPGDQLVSVNHTLLDLLTLTEAVEVLKSVPPGTVRLGVRKPLVSPDLLLYRSRPYRVSPGPTRVQGLRHFLSQSFSFRLNAEFWTIRYFVELPVDEPFLQVEAADPSRENMIQDSPRGGPLPEVSTVFLMLCSLWIRTRRLNGDLVNLFYQIPLVAVLASPGSHYVQKAAAEASVITLRARSLFCRPASLHAPSAQPAASFFNVSVHRVLQYSVTAVLLLLLQKRSASLCSISAPDAQSNHSRLGHVPTEDTLTSEPLDGGQQHFSRIKGPSENSELPDDSCQEEPELILDGGLPRYASSVTSDLLPAEETDPGNLPEREEGEGEETPAFSHWGAPRRVEVWPEDGQSLGLSIVGGRHVIKRLKNGEELKGIFIKQVLAGSPAARTRCLKTGDKILEVSGVDLRAASHEEAVSVIKSAPSPVVFIVQSLSATPRVNGSHQNFSGLGQKLSKNQKMNSCLKADEVPETALPPLREPPPYRPPSQSEQELTAHLQKVKERCCERYGDLQGELLCVDLEKDQQGLGLSLAGNRDRSRLSIFVVGLHPGGPASRDGRIRVGDELLEINNQILYGRSHQNASAIIKTAAANVKLILLRNDDAVNQMAVSPLTAPTLIPGGLE